MEDIKVLIRVIKNLRVELIHKKENKTACSFINEEILALERIKDKVISFGIIKDLLNKPNKG